MNNKAANKTNAWVGRLGLIRVGIGMMTRAEIRQMAGVVMLMILTGVFESAVVALVLPLVYVIVDPVKFEATKFGRLTADFLGTQSLTSAFGYLAAALVILLVTASVMSAITTYLSQRHIAKSMNRFSHELLVQTLSAPYLWLLENNTAVIGRRFYEDVRVWRRDFVHSLLAILQSAIMIVAPSSVALALAPSRGFLALLVVAIGCAVVVVVIRRRLSAVSRAVQVSANVTIKTLLQLLSGMREIKVSGHMAYFVSRFDQNHAELNQYITTRLLLGSAPAQIINVGGQIGFVATAAVLWWRGASGTEIAAQLALIGIVVSRVVPAFSRLASNLTNLLRAAPIVETLVQFRDSIAIAERKFGRRHLDGAVPENWSNLKLESLQFHYPKSRAATIDGISIELKRNKTYGFVGRSGAGKSTLINLLLGLIEPTAGAVMLEDAPLSQMSLTDWFGRIGYVPQDPVIFDSSMLDNIVFGEKYDNLLLAKVLESASLASVIAELPNGVNTMVGERGRRFSGGQAQRIALARALYKKPDILILDEATSALDSITEAEIYDSVDAWPHPITTLIISHRAISLRKCEKIFVMANGKVVESGTFNALMENSSLFRALASEEHKDEQVVH